MTTRLSATPFRIPQLLTQALLLVITTAIPSIAVQQTKNEAQPLPSDAIIFLSLNGSDSNDGLSPGTAKATLSGAYSALPPNGGTVYILGSSRCYMLSSPTTFGIAGKHAMLVGVGQRETCFDYSAKAGAAITWDTYKVSANNFYSQAATDGMSGIYLAGPGPYTTTTGVGVGGSANGVAGFLMANSDIQGFGVALAFTNPNNNMWFHRFVNSSFYGNGQGFSVSTTFQGENNAFDHCAFSGLYSAGAEVPNYVAIGGGDWHFSDTSFDGAQLVLSKGGNNANVQMTNMHFENPGSASANTSNPFVVVNSGQLTIDNSQFLNDIQSGFSPPEEYIDVTGGNAYLSGIQFSGASGAIVYGVHFQGGYLYLNASNYFGARRLYDAPSGNLYIVDDQLGQITLLHDYAGDVIVPASSGLNTVTLPSQSGTIGLVLTATVSGSTASLAANTCGDAVTARVGGARASMVVVASPSALPQAGLRPYVYVSAPNTVTLEYCNDTNRRITPDSQTFQIRVIQ